MDGLILANKETIRNKILLFLTRMLTFLLATFKIAMPDLFYLKNAMGSAEAPHGLYFAA
jgi:hypothetical protein